MIGWLAMLALGAPEPDPEPEPVWDEVIPLGPDRSGPPEVASPIPLELPQPGLHELAPGLTVWHVRAPQVRKLAVHVILHRGMVELLGGPTEAGRAMGWLADAAAGEYSATELSATADLHEVELWTSIGLHQGRVSLVMPLDERALGMDLQRLVLTESSFPNKDLKRYLRDQALYYEVSGPASPARVVSSALGFAWFPADHPYGARPDLEALGKVKRGPMPAMYADWLESTPATVVVVGDIEWDAIEAPLMKTLAGVGFAGPQGEPVADPIRDGLRVLAVDMPGQEQVSVRLRTQAPDQDHEDRPAMLATNWVLGGHFLSRLNQILREERGYTYGSWSSYRTGRGWGTVTVGVDVGSENLAETIEVIREQVGDLVADGVEDTELETARRSMVQDWNLTFQTAQRAAGLYVDVVDEQSTIDAFRQRHLDLAELTSAEAQAVASRWMATDKPRVWVFVGDRDKMAPELVEAGLDAEWLTPQQAILGNF